MIRDESIEGYVERLASGEPTPGGGATGALLLAQGVGLLAMAARFSDHEELAGRAATLASRALALSDDDEQAFARVSEAFGLPKETDSDRQERSHRIQEAIRAAAVPPRDLVETSGDALRIAEDVLADCNTNVLSDVAAGLGCVRGTLVAAAATLETDLAPLQDEDARTQVSTDIGEADRLAGRADDLIGHTRRRIRG
ncbi:cyclodeaminase/cyclohydrolase family protein [Citricoccus sp.]|uniref:cyclodeaminase/cyclohydrolase family protein n=1 Tax=Citricoccus sp. TaxID=1978372 RepID=UPI0028BF2CCB|nr:cyclodeaminase/cyclohydrolase family protein [Citricoccus sp.]